MLSESIAHKVNVVKTQRPAEGQPGSGETNFVVTHLQQTAENMQSSVTR